MEDNPLAARLHAYFHKLERRSDVSVESLAQQYQACPLDLWQLLDDRYGTHACLIEQVRLRNQRRKERSVRRRQAREDVNSWKCRQCRYVNESCDVCEFCDEPRSCVQDDDHHNGSGQNSECVSFRHFLQSNDPPSSSSSFPSPPSSPLTHSHRKRPDPHLHDMSIPQFDDDDDDGKEPHQHDSEISFEQLNRAHRHGLLNSGSEVPALLRSCSIVRSHGRIALHRRDGSDGKLQEVVEGSQFGASWELLTLVRVAGYEERIPSVLDTLKEMLISSGGLLLEGIFRVSPVDSEARSLRRRLEMDEGGAASEAYNAYSVAYLIKLWFSQMPTPLLEPSASVVIETGRHPSKTPRLIRRLSKRARGVFLWLLDLCILVAEKRNHNLMDTHALSIVIAPNLVSRSRDTVEDLKFVQHVAKCVENAVKWRYRTRSA